MQVGKLEEWSQEKNRGKIVVCKESFNTILATQTQHTAILRQLQHHLGLPSATEHLTPTTAVLHSEATEPHAPPDPNTENAETSTWAISLPASSSPFLNIYILYFYVFSLWNPIFLVLYNGIGCITCFSYKIVLPSSNTNLYHVWAHLSLYYFNSSTH